MFARVADHTFGPGACKWEHSFLATRERYIGGVQRGIWTENKIALSCSEVFFLAYYVNYCKEHCRYLAGFSVCTAGLSPGTPFVGCK